MNIYDRAKRDLRQISTNKSGAGIALRFKPTQDDDETEITGVFTKHHLGVDPDTSRFVNFKNAHISFSEAELVEKGYTVRDAKNEVALIGHLVTVYDVNTEADITYVIEQNMADETVGYILCILGDYSND